MTEALPSAPTRDQVVGALTKSLMPLAHDRGVVTIFISNDLKALLRDFVSEESAGDPRAAAGCLIDVLEATLDFTSVLPVDFVPWVLAVIQDFPQEVLTASLPVLEARFRVACRKDYDQDAYYQEVLFEADSKGIVCQGLMGPTGMVQPSRGGCVRVVRNLQSGFRARLQQFSG